MRAVFTRNFFSSQSTDTQTTIDATPLVTRSIRYDERRYGSVDAFMRHADFAPFKQHFIGLIDQVIAFAHSHAGALTPPIGTSRKPHWNLLAK